MNRLSLSRVALSVCIAAILLAACKGSQSATRNLRRRAAKHRGDAGGA